MKWVHFLKQSYLGGPFILCVVEGIIAGRYLLLECVCLSSEVHALCVEGANFKVSHIQLGQPHCESVTQVGHVWGSGLFPLLPLFGLGSMVTEQFCGRTPLNPCFSAMLVSLCKNNFVNCTSYFKRKQSY